MLDSNTILGTRGYLECDKYEHGLLIQNNEIWPCGTPIVYAANSLKKDARLHPSVRVYTIMPPNQHASHGNEIAQVELQAISPIGLKPLCENHKILAVSSFDFGKFDRLLEFIRDVGGISLIVEYEEGRRELAESVKRVEGAFKYCSPFSYDVWSDKHLWSKDDKFVCVLTFLDMPYCVPLFNMRKVDGIGLSFCGATVQASIDYGYLNKTFRTDLMYSNYEDNVFFMDGIAVNSMRRPDSTLYSELNKLTVKHLEIGKPGKKRMFNRPSAGDLVSVVTENIAFSYPPPETQPDEAVEPAPDDGPEEAETSPEQVSSLYHNGNPVQQEVSTLDGTVTYYTTTGGQDFSVDFDSNNTDDNTEPEAENH